MKLGTLIAFEKKVYIREYIFVFATLYSRYESYSSLGVFVSALVAGINMVTFFDNFFYYWGCGRHFNFSDDGCYVDTVTGQENTLFFIL